MNQFEKSFRPDAAEGGYLAPTVEVIMMVPVSVLCMSTQQYEDGGSIDEYFG